jgi:hypothetical protein
VLYNFHLRDDGNARRYIAEWGHAWAPLAASGLEGIHAFNGMGATPTATR